MELNEQVGIQVQADLPKNDFWLKNKKKILITAISVLLILFLAIIIFIPKKPSEIKNNRPIITPPMGIITSTPALLRTKWASDAAVLKIENDNRNLTNDLNNIDLSETTLSLPNIDVNVDFQK